MTQQIMAQEKLMIQAKKIAAALCVADVRYDPNIDLAETVAVFAQLMMEKRFLPSFFMHPAQQPFHWAECRPKNVCHFPLDNVLVSPMATRKGVWFPKRIAQENAFACFGSLIIGTEQLRQPLLPDEGVCAGSLNLPVHCTKQGRIDYVQLEKTIFEAVHCLDNAVDLSYYPTAQQSRFTRGTRKIALSMMGLAQVLEIYGYPYDTKQARDFAQEIAQFIEQKSHEASEYWMKKRGPFALWKEGTKQKLPCRRNLTLTGIYPDEKIAAICGVTPGIMPKERVSPKACIKMQAAVQTYTQGNVYLPILLQTKKEMEEICSLAYDLGCMAVEVVQKTGTQRMPYSENF